MNTRFLIFIIIVVLIVSVLVYIELGRENPWNSDVFFGLLDQVNTEQTAIT
jgi:hypothetical protein